MVPIRLERDTAYVRRRDKLAHHEDGLEEDKDLQDGGGRSIHLEKCGWVAGAGGSGGALLQQRTTGEAVQCAPTLTA